jgi:DNA-binding NarL/FixJ family response regulator
MGNEMHWRPATPSRSFTVARPVTPREHTALTQAMVQARTALTEAASATAVAAQRTRSMAAALDELLLFLTASEKGTIQAPRLGADHERRTIALSPREREVLTLVAEGRSNKEIAAALFLSPNTVKTHVASLLNKLHADTRAQLAAISASQLEPLRQER